jgi:cobalt-zinc-cadmium efflux system membrane fusion protein
MKKYSILFLASLLLAACGSNTKNETTNESVVTSSSVQLTDEQLKNMELQTDTLKQKSISSLLKVNGIIDVPPQNMVSISVPLGGFLKSTKLLPGMHITKGEIIATMEDQQYIQLQQEYLTTAANLTYAEADFNRQKDLNQSKAASDKTYQQAEAAYKSLKITLKSLSEKLKLIGISPDNLNETNLSRSINIPSPIDGYVSAVNVNIGKYVNPTDVLFQLVNPADIHLALTVYEKDLDKIFIGQKLMAYTNNQPDKKHPCEIILIGKDLSNERSVQVHCHFEDYDKTLIPGMFMNAELNVQSTQAKVLPEEAIVRFENKKYVYEVKDKNNFEMLEVSLGETQNNFTEIKSLNKAGAKRYVTKGAYTLLMKMKNNDK